MIPNYVQIDMVIVSINTGNHTISLNKHTIGLEIYNSTRQCTFRPMCTLRDGVDRIIGGSGDSWPLVGLEGSHHRKVHGQSNLGWL